MTRRDIKKETFAGRVRRLLDEHRMSLADLAEKAELAPSLVSKLLTDTDASRREPRIEHVILIARALETTPQTLVAGTDAETVLSDWVPRAELENESRLRAEIQAKTGRLETELKASRAECTAARGELTELNNKLARVESKCREDLSAARIARNTAEAGLAAMSVERDRAVEFATEAQNHSAAARASLQQVQRDLEAAKSSATTKVWLSLIGGAIGGLALGAAGSSSDEDDE